MGEKMRAIALLVVLFFAAPSFAQTLEQQEKLNQYDKAISALDNLKALTDKMAKDKKAQCITAIASETLCECLSSNLPVVINFVQYVAIITQTKEDLQYDKQSKQDKDIIDNVRMSRDKCRSRRR
jgi:hypothetical protein